MLGFLVLEIILLGQAIELKYIRILNRRKITVSFSAKQWQGAHVIIEKRE